MKIAIVSGYFNPLHVGHLELFEKSRALSDKLVIIINNDDQQLLKKGKIIIPLDERTRIVRALRVADEVVKSIDTDPTVCKTLEQIAKDNEEHELLFCNGGDRDSKKRIPETDVCEKYNITMHVGLTPQLESSSRINKELGR